jgi:methane/ammonia monooxygenase subunit C
MSFITNIWQGRATTLVATPEQKIIDLKFMWIAVMAICALYVGARTYEDIFGWSTGMDSHSVEFEIHWMMLLYVMIPLELITFIALITYLWATRDVDVANIGPREELRRTFNLFGWIVLYGVAFAWGTSFFTEQDAAWHSVAMRDSAFTPANIMRFYVSYPVYIIIAIGGFMYAQTRLPVFARKGPSLAHLLLIVGPFMILPSAAFSEWGATYWYMEELFVAPLHWTFVFFGWFALAVFGLSLQILERIQELCAGDEEFSVGRESIVS